jgi:hypothetical protein
MGIRQIRQLMDHATVTILRLDVGLGLEQQLDDGLMPVPGGPRQRV